MHTIAPFDWSSRRKPSRRKPGGAKPSETIFNEAGEFHLKDGLSVPIRGLNNTFSVFSAVADGTEAERAEALKLNSDVVTLLATLVHERSLKLLKNKPSSSESDPNLSAREREVIKWVASGKTSLDIAEILKISEATANAHVQAAMIKLNATTRTHAAVIAVLSGIVDPA